VVGFVGVAGIPVAAVVPGVRGEVADVVDEGAGVAEGEAGAAAELGEGVAGAELVGGDAVVEAEDLFEVVVGVVPGGAVVLGGFEAHGVVGVLDAGVLAGARVPFRPVDGLVEG